ncbi:RNA ligase [Thermocrinis minervae]|uniref:Putative ATP-dependent DNA ligase n=1 Tax=Thermocrinis minervae TaxID=381751 RepID=A0A1M6R4Q7_9AQUI|nr:RNA ligase [Thermocrinis minervae]SHK27328.1 putative ATP-dependent DNA ligase [Thermocrinis minervae]
MLDASLVKEALKKSKVKSEQFKDLEYLRFTDDYKNIPRGTVIFQEFTIFGYPHIGRIFQLSTGLREQFTEPFWVEEKVDGYNLRIFYHKGEVYALTRSGLICAFSTDRVLDFIDKRFFEDNPDLVLCAEMAGPENPYVEESPPYVKEDVRLFVFDIMRKNESTFLPQREKLELIEKYSLPSVEVFGRFTVDQVEKIKDLLRKLDQECREGVVFKEDSERNKRVKYITRYANLNDIRITSLNIMGLPADYYTNRLLRLALFIEEEGLEKDDSLYTELGKAFLEGIFQACKLSREEGKVYRTFRCRFHSKENLLIFLEQIKHSSAHIQIIERGIRQEGNMYVLEFDKVFLNMTGLLGHVLRGGSVFD